MRPLFDKKDMEKVKVKRMKDEKCKRILNQILANVTFISVLLLNCYINKSSKYISDKYEPIDNKVSFKRLVDLIKSSIY